MKFEEFQNRMDTFFNMLSLLYKNKIDICYDLDLSTYISKGGRSRRYIRLYLKNSSEWSHPVFQSSFKLATNYILLLDLSISKLIKIKNNFNKSNTFKYTVPTPYFVQEDIYSLTFNEAFSLFEEKIHIALSQNTSFLV